MKYPSLARKLVLYICSVLAIFVISAPVAVYAQSADECGTDACKNLLNKFTDFLNLLSALVGVAVIGSIIWGGIQYITAADNAQQLSAAKTRIRNALIALLAYFLLYAFLQWLIPGGAF